MEQSKVTGGIGGAASGAAAGSAFGPWGAAIGGVIGGIGGILGGGGEDEAQELAEEQARFHEMQQAENKRRQMLQMGQLLGTAKAASYASGLQQSGSTRRYQTELESRFRQDMAWDAMKARVEAKMLRKGGQIAADTISRSSTAGMIGSLTGALGAFAPTGGSSGWNSSNTVRGKQSDLLGPKKF